MDKEALHHQVETFNHTNWHVRAIIHALIDLGRITTLECQLPECVLDKRRFKPRAPGRGYQPYSLTLDHIEPQFNGKNHRPENLRILHHACNLACERGRPDSDEARLKKKAATARRLADPVQAAAWKAAVAAKRSPGWNKITRPDDKRRAGSGRKSRPKLLAPRQVAAARRAYARGVIIDDLAKKYGVSRGTMHSVVAHKNAYKD